MGKQNSLNQTDIRGAHQFSRCLETHRESFIMLATKHTGLFIILFFFGGTGGVFHHSFAFLVHCLLQQRAGQRILFLKDVQRRIIHTESTRGVFTSLVITVYPVLFKDSHFSEQFDICGAGRRPIRSHPDRLGSKMDRTATIVPFAEKSWRWSFEWSPKVGGIHWLQPPNPGGQTFFKAN